MKILVCKTYSFDKAIYKMDRLSYNNGEDITWRSDYSSYFDEEDVTTEQLLDYIKKGFAIKINC